MSYKQKKEVIKNVKKLKGSDIFINEDFCFETMQRRKELWEEGKRLRSEGQIIFFELSVNRCEGRRDSGD